MKHQLKQPYFRVLNDPDDMYYRHETPKANQDDADVLPAVYVSDEISTTTKRRLITGTLSFVIFGLPEDEEIFSAKYRAYLDEMKVWRRDCVDDRVKALQPIDPTPHRPARVRLSLTIEEASRGDSWERRENKVDAWVDGFHITYSRVYGGRRFRVTDIIKALEYDAVFQEAAPERYSMGYYKQAEEYFAAGLLWASERILRVMGEQPMVDDSE